jgi:hypothetical protein
VDLPEDVGSDVGLDADGIQCGFCNDSRNDETDVVGVAAVSLGKAAFHVWNV